MTVISEPFVTVNIVNASLSISNVGQRVLFIGQQKNGTAISGELQQNILNDSSWNALFGINSMLAAMISSARLLNQVVPFDAIGLDDNGSGVAATGSINISGTATEDGTLIVIIASDKNHKFTIPVASGDTAATIVTAIFDALLLDDSLPVIPVDNVTNVALTAVNAGTYGNTLGLSISGIIDGIIIGVTGMSGGSIDPSLTGVFDVVGNTRYQTVIWPFTNVTELVSFLDPRFNVNNIILDGAGFVSVTDSLANHLSRLGALNSENLVEICDTQEDTGTFSGPAQLEIPAVKASQFGAIRSIRLSDGANIDDFVISANGALDAFGGAALASKPYANTPFTNLPLIPVDFGFTDATEISQIEAAGGSIIGNNSAGTGTIIGRVSTTYKTDSAGNADLTFKFLNFRDTASSAREFFFNNLKSRFSQSRLTSGNVIKGRDIVDALVIKAFMEQLYQSLSGPEFVLVQDGEAAIKFFKDNLVVTLNLSNGTATVQCEVPIVTQLRNIVVTMKITFSTES